MVEWKGIEPSTFARLSQPYIFNYLRASDEKAKVTFVTAFGPPAWANDLPEVYRQATKVCPQSEVADLGHLGSLAHNSISRLWIEPRTTMAGGGMLIGSGECCTFVQLCLTAPKPAHSAALLPAAAPTSTRRWSSKGPAARNTRRPSIAATVAA